MKHSKTHLILIVVVLLIFVVYEKDNNADGFSALSTWTKSEKTIGFISVRNLLKRFNNNAVAFLYNDQVQNLAPRIAALDTLLKDNRKADVIIFHTGFPLKNNAEAVANATVRQVIFFNVDLFFTSFPVGFDPYVEEPNWVKRGKWNYQQMCRFWFKFVIDIPIVKKYNYLMRLDDDSKLLGVWFNVFDFMKKKGAIYFANVEESDDGKELPGLMKLKTLTYDYIRKYNITPKNPARLRRAFDIPNRIRLYNTNFDIIHVNFFQSDEIHHWVKSVDESFGILKYRWGDHVLRYLTTAIFADASQVLLRTDFQLPYCHPC